MYSTNEEFLEAIKEYERKEIIPGLFDKGFAEIVLERRKQFSLDNKSDSLESGNDKILSYLRQDILDNLTQEDRLVVNSIPMGVIHTGEFNAIFASSGYGQEAILLSRGLMLLLHKVAKYLIAMVAPNSVTYCNRGNSSPKAIESYLYESIEFYKENLETQGALIHLDLERQTYAGIMTNIWEFFILSHEVGHALESDENNESSNFIKWSKIPIIKIFALKNHSKELKADIFAAKLAIKYGNNKYNLSQQEVLDFIRSLFNLIGRISTYNESYTHPSPQQRIENINSNLR
jgi:hypothetical protein